MHPGTLLTTYPPARHHEPQCYYMTTYQHNVSATQALAGLQNDVKRLRDTEHLLQQQIHRYRSSLEEVQAVLYTKINRANEMQNFLAPVSRLPNELLLAIFEEVVACQIPGAVGRAEFILSKVSRRWRGLAIHSPRLWRRVSITPRVSPVMLDVYKTRASRALDIEIWGWRDRRDFQRFDTALEKMLDTTSRWRSLLIACVCDSHLSHLTLKLAHVGHFTALKHFTFRALRPGQICPVSFLMESTSTVQPCATSQSSSPCPLRSLDAENFTLMGDLGGIYARAVQNFAKLSSLTLRRYNNDSRPLRIVIEFSALRAMLSAIPNLTTLVLHGQPLRFRTGPASGPQGQDDMYGSGVGAGGGIGVANSAVISLPHLHTLVLHPGVLKPRYLQHTISAIHAPALRHFELVFPDSRMSGQNITERLFMDAPPSAPFASSSSSYGTYASASSATEEYARRRRPRFPRVETLILNNASSAGSALMFIHAFPCATQVTLGKLDVGLVLRARAEVGMGVVTGPVPSKIPASASMCRPSEPSVRHAHTRPVHWPRLHTLTLRQPRLDALRGIFDWIYHESKRGHPMPRLVIQAPLDRLDVRQFAQVARGYTVVELVGIQDDDTWAV